MSNQSRQLTFRAWNNATRRFIDLSLLGNAFLHQSNTEGLVLFGSGGYAYPDVTIEQFTGLKDNHGEDIYEGDLIQFDINGITHGPEREEGIIGRVWHCDEDACWAIGRWTAHHHDGKAYDWWYTFTDRIDRKTLVVLGNVHENPEIKEKP